MSLECAKDTAPCVSLSQAPLSLRSSSLCGEGEGMFAAVASQLYVPQCQHGLQLLLDNRREKTGVF